MYKHGYVHIRSRLAVANMPPAMLRPPEAEPARVAPASRTGGTSSELDRAGSAAIPHPHRPPAILADLVAIPRGPPLNHSTQLLALLYWQALRTAAWNPVSRSPNAMYHL